MEKELYLEKNQRWAKHLENKAALHRARINSLLEEVASDESSGIKLGRNTRLLSRKYLNLKDDPKFAIQGYLISYNQREVRSAAAKLGHLRRKARLAKEAEATLEITPIEKVISEIIKPPILTDRKSEFSLKSFFRSAQVFTNFYDLGKHIVTAVAGSGIFVLGTATVASAFSAEQNKNIVPTPTPAYVSTLKTDSIITLDNHTLTIKAILTPTPEATVSKTPTRTSTPTETATATLTVISTPTKDIPTSTATSSPTKVSTSQVAPKLEATAVIAPKQATNSNKPTPSEVEAMIREIWGTNATYGIPIAKCESGLDPDAYQVIRNKDGIPDEGVFQIHGDFSVNGVPLRGNSYASARVNIQYAFDEKFKPHGLDPWSSSRSCWGPLVNKGFSLKNIFKLF